MKRCFTMVIFSLFILQLILFPKNTFAMSPPYLRDIVPVLSLINVGDFEANINKVDIKYEFNKIKPQVIFDYYIENTSNTDKTLKILQPTKDTDQYSLESLTIKEDNVKTINSLKIFKSLGYDYEIKDKYGYLKVDEYINSFNKYQEGFKEKFDFNKEVYVYKLSTSVAGLGKEAFEFNSEKSMINSFSHMQSAYDSVKKEFIDDPNKFVIDKTAKYLVEVPISKNGKPTLKHKDSNAFSMKKMPLKDFLMNYTIPEKFSYIFRKDEGIPAKDEILKFLMNTVDDIYTRFKEEGEDNKDILSRILESMTHISIDRSYIASYIQIVLPPNKEKKLSVSFDITEDFIGFDYTKKGYDSISLEYYFEYLKSFKGPKEINVKAYANSKYPFMVKSSVPFKKSVDNKFYFSKFKISEKNMLSMIFCNKNFNYDKTPLRTEYWHYKYEF